MLEIPPVAAWSGARGRARPRARVLGLLGAGRADAVVIGAALACWAVALRGAHQARVSGFGLLAVLPPAYYVALALLLGGFAVAASRRRVSPPVLAAYVVAWVVVVHATVAILYAEPRYTWTYKHVGVIDAIGATGSADRSIDVYQNWPGFFALVAWFTRAAGIDPIDAARWAQPSFALAEAAVVLFCLRGLTRDPRQVWMATWIFVVGNWIGQEYLAPQALGFILAGVVVGVALRARRPVPDGMPRGPGVARRVRAWALRSASRPATAGDGAWVSTRGTLLLGAFGTLAVIVSHQLSPVFLVAALAALALMTPWPPPWAVAVVIAVQAWWIALAWPFLGKHFDLVSLGTPSGEGAGASLEHALPGASFGAAAARGGVALVFVLAAVGFARRRREGHRDVALATLAVVPWFVAAVQSYDGEGPLRAYLFALPWLAFLVASACRPRGDAVGVVRRSWRLAAASAAIAACTLFGYFGQGAIQVMAPADVAASRWVLAHTPPESTLALVAPNFPDRPTRRYVDHLSPFVALTDVPGFRGRRLGARDLPAVAALLRRTRAPRYLILSPSQRRYARYYGLLPAGTFRSLAAALRASPRFRLVFRAGAAQVYALRSGPASGRTKRAAYHASPRPAGSQPASTSPAVSRPSSSWNSRRD